MMERAAVIRSSVVSGSYSQKRSSFIRDRDASFSSYLPPDRDNPGRRSMEDSTAEISIFDAQKYFSELSAVEAHQKAAATNNNRVSPLDNIETAAPRFSSPSSSVDGRNYRARSFHASAAATTPTASSEASWNSQTGLLSVQPGTAAIGVSVRNLQDEKRSGSSINSSSFSAARWLNYRRKCPCSGKKSVQVKEKSLVTPKISTQNRSTTPPPLQSAAKAMETVKSETASYKLPHPKPDYRICNPITSSGGFSFPILNANVVLPSSATVQLQPRVSLLPNSVEDPPRDSLEVFRPVSSRKSSADFARDRNGNHAISNNDDDVASDASSDLFEIESFSTGQTTATTATTATHPSMFHYHHCHRRDSLDEAATFQSLRRFAGNGVPTAMLSMYGRRSVDEPMTPSTEYCYEPSEASIDWSVTTAEGFDRASVANASEAEVGIVASAEAERSRRRQSAGGGLLLSCRCEKAVSVVGPQPVKTGATTSFYNGSGVGPGVRSASGSSTLGMWGVGTTAPNKTSLARSHSARLSLPFATS